MTQQQRQATIRTMSTADILRAAKAKISTPDKWTKGARARTACGILTTPQYPEAARWCAVGAIAAVAPTEVEAARGVLSRALPARHRDSYPEEYNDSRKSHAVIMRWFDRAIRIAEREGL